MRQNSYVASIYILGTEKLVAEDMMARSRTSTKTFTFRHPFFLKGVGMELPAGTYEVEYEEHEMALRGNVYWHIMRCSIPVPPALLRPGLLGAAASIDHRELERVYAEDCSKT